MPVSLVHCSPQAPFSILGVWLSPTVSAYLHTVSRQAAVSTGNAVMRTMGRAMSWDEWAAHLDAERVTTAMWRAVPRAYGEEARHVLARVVATDAVARRDASR